MKLKEKVENVIEIITFFIIMFICLIDDIKNTTGLIIYGFLILIIVFNTIILYKYGKDD